MTNTNESGRSMVEMLGVLAIIGVLSVMGIAGYTQAMKKYRANEAAQAITIAGILCATGQMGGYTPDDKYITSLGTCSGANTNSATLTGIALATGIDGEMVRAVLGDRASGSGSTVNFTVS